MKSRRDRPEIVTISWRDVPAQVNGVHGRLRHQIVLSPKFQRAIDRAKRKARITTAQDDVAQWRRTSTAGQGDVVAAAAAEAARLERVYSTQYLAQLAYVGGYAADLPPHVGRPDDHHPLAPGGAGTGRQEDRA